ncbi:adapter protein CIKS isoform X1 [Scleropages formosus]|uniref:E3 ubiquitin ligase TRAF3IP2 n=1 Tax=Scleropages formosus TaxID=113540 RepID=A0A8C9UZ68_SCLFO|nr:adapter protein CIKS-like isoform X1 [Scleropages formosus]
MMLPTVAISAATQQYRHLTQLEAEVMPRPGSLNHPEENDETLSEDRPSSAESFSSIRCLDPSPQSLSSVSHSSRMAEMPCFGQEPMRHDYGAYQPPLGLPVGYSPLTPYPSQADDCHSTMDSRKEGWLPPSCASSLPSYLSSLERASYTQRRSQSLPSRHSPSMGSLEQPFPLCSIPPPGALPNYCLQPCHYGPQAAACYALCPGQAFALGPSPHHFPRPEYHWPYRPHGPDPCGCHDVGFAQSSGYPPPQAQQKVTRPIAPLSLAQRKAFVTYEADSDKHVNEIIKFVALLRHNGFDTHIDVFEQQFRSISKIDFMEKYINEKDYLIIIAISPKYYETVTGARMSVDNDERTLNTVYIHKQLQNEFIQNGSRNFRFIPILFPGAKKCHVPAWLQNTHVYSWPKDRDDILRRLMRVEKYKPPPIGVLPTIISIPL